MSAGWAQRHEDHAVLGFRYDALAVQTLKATVPSSAREWTKARRVWAVYEPYVDATIRAVSMRLGPLDIRRWIGGRPASWRATQSPRHRRLRQRARTHAESAYCATTVL